MKRQTKLILIVMALTLINLAKADAQTTIDAVITASHQSDIMRGMLFSPPANGEPTVDTVSAGITITRAKLEVDLTAGAHTIDCERVSECEWAPMIETGVRFYPWTNTPRGLYPFVSGQVQIGERSNAIVSFGVTFALSKRFQFDLSHGVKFINSSLYEEGAQSGTELSVRIYPAGKK